MSNTPVDTDDNDFVLKHRIAGAAFLLFFGALVLPWLLGAPTDAKKIEQADVAQPPPPTQEYVPEDLENEVLTQLKDEAAADEKVYISKVTPAGFAQVSDSSVASDEQKKAQIAEVQEKAEEKAQKEANDLAASKKQAQERAAKLAKFEEDELEKQKQAALAKEQKKPVAESKPPVKQATEPVANIKSGWIVQVGVFTDKSGADKISKSLSDKGFKASSTIVDTNKGPKTGTRVWLGPFSDRTQATTAKTSLADKTGTSGFIRAYP